MSATSTRLPPAARCDNCRRVVTPTHRVAMMVEGGKADMRRMCTACISDARDAFKRPTGWLATTGSGRV